MPSPSHGPKPSDSGSQAARRSSRRSASDPPAGSPPSASAPLSSASLLPSASPSPPPSSVPSPPSSPSPSPSPSSPSPSSPSSAYSPSPSPSSASPSRQRRATVHDVAAAAGISRGTVSRVLNGGYVSAEARAAIEAAIAEVGYVPNTAARNLVMRRSQAVGFLALEPHSLLLDDPNIGAIMLGANEVLSIADHQMVNLVVDSARDTERVARYLSGGFVDGAIIVSARTHDPITKVIAELRLPATFVGHPPDLHRSIPYVGIDNVGSARSITERLAATGRRHIGMIAAALDRDSGADRLTGFRAALGDRFDPSLVVEVPLYDYASGVKGMRELLARQPAIDGVFAASDAVAAGALEVLRDAGRTAPSDIGVVGFDDSTWALRTQPPLSTVHQPAREIGRNAAELVLRQLRDETPLPGNILLPTPIVWRNSA